MHAPVIALLLHLLEPAFAAGEKTEALVADLHRAVEVAVAREATAVAIAGAVRSALDVTVQELRGSALPAGQFAAYSRRLGRVREFVLATASTAYDAALRNAGKNVVHLPAGHPGAGDSAGASAVVALEFDTGALAEPAPNRRVSAGRIESCLARDADIRTVSLITEHGGTLAVPADGETDTRVARIVARLRGLLHVQVTATVLFCRRDEIEDSIDTVHEMLDVVRRLGYPHGVYPFDRIALEYQVTRPGRARESLARIADALDGHPDLIDALLAYIRCDGSRKSTARQLHVHPNTLDYRFRRIHQVTGYDPTTVSGLSKLQAAIVIGAYKSSRYPGPSVPLPQSRIRPGTAAVGKAV